MKVIKKHRNLILRVIDILIILIAYYIATVLINNSIIITSELNQTIRTTILLAIVIYSGMLHAFKTYQNITRYENGQDYLVYVLACLISYIIISIIKMAGYINLANSRINIIAALIIVVGVIGYRVLLRLLLTEGNNKLPQAEETGDNKKKKVLIVGAGDAARVVLGTLKTTMKGIYDVVGLVDDNPNKVSYAISGKRILGTRYDIPRICKENKIELILFTISNISQQRRKEILKICQETGCKVRILPGTADLIKDKSLMDSFRDVEIEDLLGRETVQLDNENIGKMIEDKIVLVTGGGGSIGSELCRQIVKYRPKKLIMIDIYENSLYDIEQELKENYPEISVDAIIANIREKKRLDEIFAYYKPYLVFHAAAHKHVPLMEVSPLEAIKNNVFGTYNVVCCADRYRVRKMILISTDKAVNPTNIMGATKRLCEMIVQAKDKVSRTKYAAVRFGNVLGSNGSVVPLFKKQIANGGPVTVTHKEITRFFMTIPEAVSLVLQAMSYAEGGEIFVLDMGEPVKIYDMAVNLIKLSGLEPNVDIQIKITGLRPGEKLYEEILMSEEGLTQTAHDKIYVAQPMDIDINRINIKLRKLHALLQTCNNTQKEEIKTIMKDVVPTYKEQKIRNRKKI